MRGYRAYGVTTLLTLWLTVDGVVPIAVEAVSLQIDLGELGVGHLDLGGVLVLVESGVDLQAVWSPSR